MYYKQLDFLRFLAVALVIMQHWFKLDQVTGIDLGRLGVMAFFSLSGFLITEILLKNKSRIDEGTSTKKKVLRSFYIRRTLRIFPIYYLLLIFLLLFSFPGLRDKWGYYFFYGSNIFTFIQQKWDGSIGPFWSLAVEEQFYLVWPLLILLVPKKRMSWFFLVAAIASIGFRWLSLRMAGNISPAPDYSLSMVVLMPSCVDSFALGGLLSHLLINTEKYKSTLSFIARPSVLLLFGLTALLMARFQDNYVYYLLFPTVYSVFVTLLIYALVRGITGPWRYLFESRSLLYLGKISYGIYLYHGPLPFILSIVDFLLHKAGARISIYESVTGYPDYLKMPILLLYLIVICSLSYYLVEKPLNNLKGRFKYV